MKKICECDKKVQLGVNSTGSHSGSCLRRVKKLHEAMDPDIMGRRRRP